MSVTASFLIGILEKIFASVAIGAGKRIDPARFMPLKAYRRRLLGRMEDMPFLYKDMRLSARDDYVEPQVATVIDELNRSFGNPDLDFRKPFMRFHESRRALLFGEGGFGKTTLFRHLTIRCLQQTRAKQVLDGKRLVPVFVPLKTARTSSDFPILDAIRRSDEYFEGALGLKRLARLAKRGRLLLFLDGYDEMPHAGGMAHVQKELETIFGKYNQRSPDFFEASDHGPLYQSLQNCRVYLSSRREFFSYSPFYINNEVQRWIVKGLEDRRIELVDRIFDNYRDATAISTGLDLDAELFMQELKRTADDELHQLSRSPLFLTVMCFVYVSSMRATGASTVFSHGAFDIINECISLLISELDAAKAKGLSGAQRLALENRRSAYPEEKIEFLQYFSVQLYDQSVGLFDRVFLGQAAEKFFRGRSESVNRDEILRGLGVADPTVNIVEQIILSGIFVLADRHRNVEYFDFPHRRFRETLAVSYFNDASGAEALVRHLLDASYGELLLVYIEQSPYRRTVINAIVREIVAGNYVEEAGALFSAALSKLQDGEAQECLSALLEDIDPMRVPVLPPVLLTYVSPGPANMRLSKERIRGSIHTKNDRLFSLWIEVAAAVDAVGTQELLLSLIGELDASHLRSIIYSKLRSLESRNAKLAAAFLRKSAEDGTHLEAILDMHKNFYVGRDVVARRRFAAFLTSLIGKLHEEEAGGQVLELRQALGNASAALLSEDEPIGDFGRVRPAPWSPWR